MKAVFIDIDNTLLSFDEYVRHTMKTGFEHCGLEPYEPYMYDVFHRENNTLWRMIEQGKITFSQLEKTRWNNVFSALGIEFDGPTFERYFRKSLFDSAIPENGAYDLLERLHKKYILCAASNGPYEQQLNRLRVAGMTKYFSHVFISEKIGAQKPSKEFFDRAFADLNEGGKQLILPQDTMIIGDSLSSDIAGGRQYGMLTCFYKRDPLSPEPLPEIAPTVTVSSLSEIDI